MLGDRYGPLYLTETHFSLLKLRAYNKGLNT